MYENYWQVDRNPFENDADSRFFFLSETHQAALLKLRYLVEHRKGAGLLVGDTGAGKTYLLQVLAEQLSETHGPFVHLMFPQLPPSEFLAFLAVELGADPTVIDRGGARLDITLREIENLLLTYGEQGRHPVIMVDEAHLIDDPHVFQTLRLLLNFQQQKPTEFSLILAGHRELLVKVRRIAPLDERLSVKCLLRALTEDETRSYLDTRLDVAGARKRVFEPGAVHAIFELSGGVPRRINRICDLALLVGFADDSASISAEQVEAVAEELTAIVPD